MTLDIRHDADGGRFVATVEDGEAVLEYRRRDDEAIEYTHTFVPPPARGDGVGEVLVRHGLSFAQEAGLRVVPVCPFVGWVMRKDE